MTPDLSLYEAADRQHVNPADRCDDCGAPGGSEIFRGTIRGVPAWATWPVWLWTGTDGRNLGIHIPDIVVAGAISVRRDRLTAEPVTLRRGRCATCRKAAKALPLLEYGRHAA